MDTATALVIATSIMALGAITFSALSLAFQRSHSRKSVRPFCNVIQRVTVNGISVHIQNAGMGPMRIRKLVLMNNEGDPIQAGIPLEQFFPSELSMEVMIHQMEAYVLAPLLEIELFRCDFGVNDKEGRTLLSKERNGKFLGIEYCDIYDDVYEKVVALNMTQPR